MNDKTVIRIRDFNRFYLSVMEFYEKNYLGSEYSMTESRVLYEIYGHDECSADDIVKQLHIDKGYLSRIIKRFENRQILQRKKSEKDARFYKIQLTEKGKQTAGELIQKSNQGIKEIIQSLSEKECIQLEEAMDTISRLLAERN